MEQKAVDFKVVDADEIRRAIQKKIGHLIFRRVAKIECGQVLSVEHHFVEQNEKKGQDVDLSVGDMDPFGYVTRKVLPSDFYERKKYLDKLPSTELSTNVLIRYDGYKGTTIEKAARPEADKYDGRRIEFDMSGMNSLDIENGTFRWRNKVDPCVKNVAPNIARQNPNNISDMICGEVVETRDGHLKFSKWFICSNQFLRMWTLVMFKKHEVFYTTNYSAPNARNLDDDEFEDHLRQRVMTCNRLCTSTFRKWQLVRNGILSPKVMTTFGIIKTERESRDWVHIYAAIVLIARYNEFPSSDPRNHNIPVINDGHFSDIGYVDEQGKFCVEKSTTTRPTHYQWDIPRNFIQNFLQGIFE